MAGISHPCMKLGLYLESPGARSQGTDLWTQVLTNKEVLKTGALANHLSILYPIVLMNNNRVPGQQDSTS